MTHTSSDFHGMKSQTNEYLLLTLESRNERPKIHLSQSRTILPHFSDQTQLLNLPPLALRQLTILMFDRTGFACRLVCCFFEVSNDNSFCLNLTHNPENHTCLRWTWKLPYKFCLDYLGAKNKIEGMWYQFAALWYENLIKEFWTVRKSSAEHDPNTMK